MHKNSTIELSWSVSVLKRKRKINLQNLLLLCIYRNVFTEMADTRTFRGNFLSAKTGVRVVKAAGVYGLGTGPLAPFIAGLSFPDLGIYFFIRKK